MIIIEFLPTPRFIIGRLHRISYLEPLVFLLLLLQVFLRYRGDFHDSFYGLFTQDFPRCLMVINALGVSLIIQPALAPSSEASTYSRELRIDAVAVVTDRIEYSSSEDIAINSLAAVQWFGQLNLPFNPNFHDVEISDAYTLQPDGKKILVSPDAIFKSSLPNARQLSLFLADQRVDTIIFPNVAIGGNFWR